MHGFQQPQQSQRPQRGRNIEARLIISLHEAYHGAERNFSLDANGNGSTKTYKIKIPAGSTSGSVIRLGGQGMKGSSSEAKSGDLLIKLDVAQDPRFKVSGKNLIHSLAISPWEAALGAQVKVPTFEGDVSLKIPAGSQGSTKLRLRDKGMLMKNSQRGDLLVVLKICVPEKLNDTEKRLFEELAENSTFNPREQ